MSPIPNHDNSDIPTSDGLVFDETGTPRPVGETIGRGGEGLVCCLANNDRVLVKTYRRTSMSGEKAGWIEDKLRVMTGMEALIKDQRLGWPRLLVFNGNGEWIGYAMRRVDGILMQTLFQPQLIKERLPHWSRMEVLRCAIYFLELVRFIHDNGALIGDINPANFLIDPDSCEVKAIDCDSYQISGNGKVYPTRVGIGMLLPPELLDADLSRTERETEHELFSVAIMLFRMFMLGLHPYSRTFGEDPVRNLRAGMCPLGIGANCRLPVGPWYNIWSHLPYGMKNLFILAFRHGHARPEVRPSVKDWLAALHAYRKGMEKGWHETMLVPAAPKSSEYKGKNALETI